MARIHNNLYATQDVLSTLTLEAGYPDRMILGVISDRLDDLYHAAKDKGEELDWATLAISTRSDDLANGLLVSCRINAA